MEAHGIENRVLRGNKDVFGWNGWVYAVIFDQ
jgi:hypothetical protein